MRRALIVVLLAGAVAVSTVKPAEARWGWGWGIGAFAIGALLGAALWRPAYAYPAYGYGYPAYGYGYPAYGYGYGYPAYGYGYAAPAYGYGYSYGYGGYSRAYYGAYAYQPSRRVRRAVYRYRYTDCFKSLGSGFAGVRRISPFQSESGARLEAADRRGPSVIVLVGFVDGEDAVPGEPRRDTD